MTGPSKNFTSTKPDNLFTADRNADVVLTNDGSVTTAVDKDGVVDSGSDAGAVIQSVINNGASYIVATQGTYQFESSVTIDTQGVRIEGTEHQRTIFRANASLSQLFEVKSVGTRLFNGPVFQFFRVAGANNATNFININSSRFGVMNKIYFQDLTGHVIYAESTEVANIDYWTFKDLIAFDCAGILDAYANAGQHFSDNHIRRCHIEGNTDWGFIIRDGLRNTLVEPFAGDNTTDMPGCVKILNDGSGSNGAEENDILWAGMENQTGTSSAVCVQIEQTAASGDFAKENFVSRARAAGSGTQTVNLTAGDVGGVRSTHIKDPRVVSAGTTEVTVDSNSVNTKINMEFETLDPSTVISDSGTRTVINKWGTNAGDPRSTGDWNGNVMQGIQIRDTTNNNSYVGIAGSWEPI